MASIVERLRKRMLIHGDDTNRGPLINPDGPESADTIELLVEALERQSRNFDLLLAGKPVRDVAEMRAETAAALAQVRADAPVSGGEG